MDIAEGLLAAFGIWFVLTLVHLAAASVGLWF